MIEEKDDPWLVGVPCPHCQILIPHGWVHKCAVLAQKVAVIRAMYDAGLARYLNPMTWV